MDRYQHAGVAGCWSARVRATSQQCGCTHCYSNPSASSNTQETLRTLMRSRREASSTLELDRSRSPDLYTAQASSYPCGACTHTLVPTLRSSAIPTSRELLDTVSAESVCPEVEVKTEYSSSEIRCNVIASTALQETATIERQVL